MVEDDGGQDHPHDPQATDAHRHPARRLLWVLLRIPPAHLPECEGDDEETKGGVRVILRGPARPGLGFHQVDV